MIPKSYKFFAQDLIPSLIFLPFERFEEVKIHNYLIKSIQYSIQSTTYIHIHKYINPLFLSLFPYSKDNLRVSVTRRKWTKVWSFEKDSNYRYSTVIPLLAPTSVRIKTKSGLLRLSYFKVINGASSRLNGSTADKALARVLRTKDALLLLLLLPPPPR